MLSTAFYNVGSTSGISTNPRALPAGSRPTTVNNLEVYVVLNDYRWILREVIDCLILIGLGYLKLVRRYLPIDTMLVHGSETIVTS